VCGEPGKFLGPAESTGWELRDQRASASVTLSSVPTMPVSIGVSKPSSDDRVDADSRAGEIARGGERQPDDPGLAALGDGSPQTA
jgi:hypothetical protein